MEILTSSNSANINFRYVFLLTYVSFTTPERLMELLEDRFNVPIPPNMNIKEFNKFKRVHVDVIRFKVIALL